MPKTADNTKPRKNATEERLRASPFREISKLEAAEEAIRLAAWQRMTEAKVISELLTKSEFKEVKEELRAGLSCAINGASKERIYKIFSEGRGLKLELNEALLKSLGEQQISLLQGAIYAGITGWGTLFWLAKGILPKLSTDTKGFPGTNSGKK